MKQILFYGALWCPDCIRAKKMLDDLKVNYQYIDVDEDEKSALKVQKINHGNRSIPTIIFPNGKILVEPNNEELSQVINENNKIKNIPD